MSSKGLEVAAKQAMLTRQACLWSVLLVYNAWLLGALLADAMTIQNATPVHAAIKTWPAAFHGQQMAISGGTQYVRVGGHGPAVLLLHGFGDTGDMWVPLAEILVKDHTHHQCSTLSGSLKVAHLRHGAMSDMSPKCVAQQTPTASCATNGE